MGEVTFAQTQVRIVLVWAIAMVACSIAMHQCGPLPALAQTSLRTPIPPSQWDDLAGVALARMIRHESRSARDADAIAWTMARRYFAHACHRGERFGEYVIETSRFLRRDRFEVHHEAAHQLRTDAELRDHLDQWARGDVPDPCRGISFQWRAPGSSAPGRRVMCGETSNRFYEHPAPGHARAVVALARGRQVCR